MQTIRASTVLKGVVTHHIPRRQPSSVLLRTSPIVRFQTDRDYMEPTIADGRANVIEDIKRDHATFFSLHRQIKEPGTNEEQKQQLVWQLIHDLVLHSIAEEEVLYPEFKNKMGTRARDHALSEHKTLKNLLSDLDSMKVTSPGFNDKIEVLMHALEHHIREEEDEMLVDYAKQVDQEQLEKMAKQFATAKQFAPTRPHANAPDKPITGNLVGNTLTAPLDWVRDWVSGRTSCSDAPAGSAQ
eukprot:GHRR01002490.1.p1 GENE.GHRR01002490.1~~GHRR01002490.1.p1  ORF type:complete len:242 (+),score=72.81 GHRR01002490.1:133-858(+)